MSSYLFRWGRFAATHTWAVIAAWVVAAVLVVGASVGLGEQMEDSFVVPGLDSQAAVDLLQSAGATGGGITAQVVMTPLDAATTFTTSPAARVALDEVQSIVAGLPHVLETTEEVSPDGTVAIVRLQYPMVADLTTADLESLKAAVAEARVGSPLQIEAGGDLFFTFEETASATSELVGLIAAMIILLIAFGSLIAMGLPIGIALIGLVVGVSSMALVTRIFDIPSWAPQMASMIALGVGIDYALLLVTRHREFLAQGLPVPEAAGRAVATAGQTVIFAGGTVVIAVLGMAFAGIPFMTAAGIATSIIVLVMVAASVTLLPALLGVAGQRINRRGRRGIVTADAHHVSARWMRWGSHVSRNAWFYLVGTTALLLALTAPVLALRLGFPDEGSLPQSRTERLAYDLVAQGFGPGINGPLLIAVDVSADPAVVEPLREAVAADPGIAFVTDPEVQTSAGVATMLAFPTTAPQEDATVATIERLREDVFPPVLAGSAASAHIGGQTASWADIGHKVRDRLPLFITGVILLSCLLLLVVFRSVLVPLKAAGMTLLSIGAAYGVIVMVFQWGWGMNLIGLESTVPVIPFIPMFMFAVLFGLSMDYEVFLLSRIREEYVRTGDITASVVRGIASSARVITSAALIMICVYFSFVFGEDPATKMMGLGLATAILIDATIVRMVLVPATMTLMGKANWWLPAWLARLLPTIDIHGDSQKSANDRLALSGRR
ncbi:MAG: MMPL family transporter [Actinomycetota bacterium]|nr:MMPL family transporter [Actinomycetota bacterium]